MPANEDDVVAERQQLPFDGANQRVVVPARQVGASDGALEQDVADDRKSLVCG